MNLIIQCYTEISAMMTKYSFIKAITKNPSIKNINGRVTNSKFIYLQVIIMKGMKNQCSISASIEYLLCDSDVRWSELIVTRHQLMGKKPLRRAIILHVFTMFSLCCEPTPCSILRAMTCANKPFLFYLCFIILYISYCN